MSSRDSPGPNTCRSYIEFNVVLTSQFDKLAPSLQKARDANCQFDDTSCQFDLACIRHAIRTESGCSPNLEKFLNVV